MKSQFRATQLLSPLNIVIFLIFIILSSQTYARPFNYGLNKESFLQKRIPSIFDQHLMSSSSGKMKRADLSESKLRLKQVPESEILAPRTSNRVLSCEAGGNPPPKIHWLKDGEKISQNVEGGRVEKVATKEGILGLSYTRSRLYLDCLQPHDSGVYTCVASNPFHRVSSDSKVKVLDDGHQSMKDEENDDGNSVALCLAKKSYGYPARIYMWTHTRLEMIGSTAQLFCRSTGVPQPTTYWLDPDNNRINSGGRMELLSNGDLVINDLKWEDMGGYTCVVENDHGSSKIETFLYPTSPGE